MCALYIMENEYENQPETKQTSSFNLKQTAKGKRYWDIKIYSDDIKELQEKTEEMDNWAREKYGEEE